MTKLLTYVFVFLFTFTSSVNAGYFVKSESGLGVFGHEIGHSMYGDDEVTAGYLGSRFADAYTDGLWINGEDYSLGSWNVADGNSLYVGQNGSDFANVKNRDDCGPLCLSVIGLTAAISIANKYFKGEEVWDNMNDDQKSNYSSSTAFKLRNVATFGFTALNTESDMLSNAVPIAEEEVSKSSFVSNVGLNMTPILYKVGENQYYSFYDLEKAKDNNFYNKIWAGTEVALTGLSLGSSIVKGVNSLRYQTLYRAVEPEELLLIKNTGKFSVIEGIETKYFTTTLKEAEDYAKLSNSVYGKNYSIVKTSILKNKLKDPLISATVEKQINAKALFEDNLKYLTKPKILNEVK